jgi:hypothetical protein
MLFDNQLHDNEPTIIQLRDRIKDHWPRSEPTTAVAATTRAPQIPTSKGQFCKAAAIQKMSEVLFLVKLYIIRKSKSN